ncbi:MAG: [protein-PII] uridylyltransferase [Nitrospirae bacterium]|nr:[protein-PII] uridylyltransferase [Nitrospirota bacterium]
MNDRTLTELAAWMEQGLRGRQLAERYTASVDDTVAGIFNALTDDPDLLLVATGGYGRRELAPFSDIDIMFLARDRKNAGAAEKVLYRLWDERLDISHAFRTLRECVEEAFRDIRTRTTLLEARYLAGSRELYSQFEKEVYPAIAYRKQRQFVAEKLSEREKRHISTGDSIYLLEPHVKEGDGGLRDIHAVLWLSRVVFRITDLQGLSAFLSGHDLKRFSDAYDFMIRLRYCLHLESGRKNDILSFEYQRAIASRLGFRDSSKFSGAERMMRYYYLKGRVIRDISHEVMVRCSRQYSPIFRDFTKKRLTDDFLLSGGKLIAKKETVFSGQSEKIMEAFYHFSKTDKGFSARLRELIRENLPRINRRTRSIPAAVNHFREIMKGRRVYETLREMHERGVLGRFIPEFGALRSLVVHEAYHMYTVDEHTLLAIRNLERLRTTTVKSLEALKEIILGMEQLDVLFLSILFHDIGKAVGRHHEEEGYKRLKSIMERLNMKPDKRLRIEFLVRNHVLMSRIAMTREIDDPELIAFFADAVGDTENLKAIYLITYADMSAVNPLFWNAWKASLLRELYERTSQYLSGTGVVGRGHDAAALFPGNAALQKEFSLFLEAMPDRYLLSTTDARLKEDFLLYQQTSARSTAVRIDVMPDGIAEIVICASDAPGLFSRIVGFLCMRRLNIVHGRIYTGKHGIVIDKIAVSNWKDVWWNGLEQDIVSGLEETVMKRKDIQLACSNPEAHGLFDAFVELDNESSDLYTLVEIFSQDRIGLLYDIAKIFYQKGVGVESARINTEASLAQDIFSLRCGGSKLDYETAYEILKELWDTLKN